MWSFSFSANTHIHTTTIVIWSIENAYGQCIQWRIFLFISCAYDIKSKAQGSNWCEKCLMEKRTFLILAFTLRIQYYRPEWKYEWNEKKNKVFFFLPLIIAFRGCAKHNFFNTPRVKIKQWQEKSQRRKMLSKIVQQIVLLLQVDFLTAAIFVSHSIFGIA